MSELAPDKLHLIRICAVKHARKVGGDWRDYMTSGYLGLLDAERLFDARKASFDTYASRRISGRIMDDYRVENHLRRTKRPKSVPLSAFKFVSAQPVNRVDSVDWVEAKIRDLPTIDRRICRLLADGYNCAEIGKKLRMKANTVSCRVSRLRGRLAI